MQNFSDLKLALFEVAHDYLQDNQAYEMAAQLDTIQSGGSLTDTSDTIQDLWKNIDSFADIINLIVQIELSTKLIKEASRG